MSVLESGSMLQRHVDPQMRGDQAPILVDPESGEITVQGQVRVRSAALASLLHALGGCGKLRFSEALEVAFGIRPFDPQIHYAKIQNLIVRLRVLLKEHGRVITRNGWIFLDADRSHFGVAAPRLQRGSKFSTPAKPRVAPTPSLIGLTETVSRKDLERRLGLPKATLNRHLNRWLERGLIYRSGRGPTVLYRRASAAEPLEA